MTDIQKSSARDVHELLLSAHPHLADDNLAKAEALAPPERDTTTAHKSFRGERLLAIQAVRRGIAKGASGAKVNSSC